MDNETFSNLDKEITLSNLNTNTINKILREIQIEIKDSEKELKKINDIDLKYFDIKLDLNRLISIIEEYKNFKISRYFKETNVFVSLNGNIYIVLELCILAILTSTKIFVDVNDCMLGTNRTIIDIINNVLSDYKIYNLINFSNNTKIQEIKNHIEKIDKLLFIDNINEYDYYKRNQIDKIVYYPIFATDIFCDDDNLEELQYTLYKYSQENGFDIEIHSDIDKEQVLETINKYSKFKNVLILTNSQEIKTLFKERIKNKKVYINENPFKSDNSSVLKADIYQ